MSKIAPEPKKKRTYTKKKKEIAVVDNNYMAVNPQTLIAQAIDKNLDIDKIEKLLAMRRELKAEWARDEYFKSLSMFQKECPIIEKKNKVPEKNKNTIRYLYETIGDIAEQIKNPLEKYGFSYAFKSRQDNDNYIAICESYHKAGHKEVTVFTVPIDKTSYMSAPQKVASASTFAERYALKKAFGITTRTEDNENNLQPEQKQKNITPEEQKAEYKKVMALVNSSKKLSKEDKNKYRKKINDCIDNFTALNNISSEILSIENIKVYNKNSEKTSEVSDKNIDPEKILAEAKRVLSTEIKGTRVFGSKDSLACLTGVKNLLTDKKYADAIAYVNLIKQQIPGGK